jgi:cytochrome c5
MKRLLATAAATVAVAAAAVSATAADIDASKLPPASDKKGVTFAKDIQPLFERSCYKCHGAEKQKGKLRLDSLEAALKGGENGPSIEKGNSAKSGIVASVARLVEDEAMPPEGKGTPFSKDEVGLLRAWIDQGAK